MSEQDKSLLDEQASLVRAVYRALPEEEIPADIEQRILANAAAAIKPNSTRRWLQWSAPLASAAVVLLVVGVVMQPQSQREMVPEQQAVTVDLRRVVPPAVVTPPPESMEESTPRMMAQKPDLSATPKALEDARVRASRPAAPAEAPAPVSAITTTIVAPAVPKREESASAAFQPPSVTAEERKQGEEDREPALAAAPQTAGASGAADAATMASERFSTDESRRTNLMRSAPAAAAQKATGANPALDISPELRARLEKFLDTRRQTNAKSGEPVLGELRREYPGVDIDAALRALELAKQEGAE